MPSKKVVKLTKSGKPDMRGKNPNSQRNLKRGQEIVIKSFKKTFGADESGEDDTDSEDEYDREIIEPEVEPEIQKKKNKVKERVIYEEESESEPEEEVIIVKKKKKPKIKEELIKQKVAIEPSLFDYANQLEDFKKKHNEEVEALKKEKDEAVKMARLGRIHQMKSNMLCRF